MKLRIGLAGCGAIGKTLAAFIQKDLRSETRLCAVYDVDSAHARAVQQKIKTVRIASSLESLVKQCDFLIEAASPQAAQQVVQTCLRFRKPALLMSGGALVFQPGLLKKIVQSAVRFFLPSGAVAGIDGLHASREAGLRRVVLTTSKSLRSLEGAPFFEKYPAKKKLHGAKEIIFKGNVAQAVRLFPKNLNVAALLALAGLGPRKTQVRVQAFRKLAENIHEVEIESRAGTIYIRAKNLPHPDNPRTSAMAIYSAQALLKKIFSKLSLGT